jgi:hypothetical protein
MTLALIISDKLDITTSRVAKAGYFVPGMRLLLDKANKSFAYENMLLQIVSHEVHVLLFLVAHPHHGARGKQFAEAYFRKQKICLPYQEEILSSIENHSNGFDSAIFAASKYSSETASCFKIISVMATTLFT